MATIGVVIPARNAATTLGRALRSVQDQRTPPDRVVVVDDHSRDETVRVARAHGAEVLSASAHGPGAARNIGARSLDTEYIAFLDADDAWPADYLDKVHEMVRQRPTALLGAGHLEVTDTGEFVAWRRPPSGGLHWLDVLRGTPIQTSGVVVARVAFWAAGGFDETLPFSQDSDLWSRLLREGASFHAVDTTVLRTLRTRPETLTKLREVEASRARLMEKLRPNLDARTWDRLRRTRLLELARRYEYSGHTAQARRCLVDTGWSPRAVGIWVFTRMPASARRLSRATVRAWRRRRVGHEAAFDLLSSSRTMPSQS